MKILQTNYHDLEKFWKTCNTLYKFYAVFDSTLVAETVEYIDIHITKIIVRIKLVVNTYQVMIANKIET